MCVPYLVYGLSAPVTFIIPNCVYMLLIYSVEHSSCLSFVNMYECRLKYVVKTGHIK
jgi:hypothetical protein